MIARKIVLLITLFWLILLAPITLFIFIAVLIRLESSGPVFYKPLMLGYRGRPFQLFRFRTMSTDPRDGTRQFTRVGRFIRNFSLDHLPTLFNLLNGTLTLVGPRPMEPEIVDLSDMEWQRYFSVKPGLINYAIIRLGKAWSPNHYTNPDLNRGLELEYIQNKSLRGDLRLLVQFLAGLIRSRGNIKSRGMPKNGDSQI